MVANTPQLGRSLTVSFIQQRERHELTPEEAPEGFIMGVTKHMVPHFPWRWPDGSTERLYSCEPGRSHYVTTGLLLPWGGCEWPHPDMEQSRSSALNRHRTQEPVSRGRRVKNGPNEKTLRASGQRITMLTISQRTAHRKFPPSNGLKYGEFQFLVTKRTQYNALTNSTSDT